VAYLRDGHAQGKSQAAGTMAEAIDNSLRFLSAEDLHAIAAYLKTVPPVRDAGDSKPVFSWGSPSDELAGIPGDGGPSNPDSMTDAQLYDAWCATCHQAPGGRGASTVPCRPSCITPRLAAPIPTIW
jgi:mono/diheme cytochrome c family protein